MTYYPGRLKRADLDFVAKVEMVTGEEFETVFPPELESLRKREKTFSISKSVDRRLLEAYQPRELPEASPHEMVERRNLVEVLLDRAHLNERAAEIIRLRFGFGEEGALTLEEVAGRFGITRERAREIEGEALKKLQEASTLYPKIDYLSANPFTFYE